MARLPRQVLPGHPHVIIHRARSGGVAFRDAADGAFYRALLEATARRTRVAIHAYALLPVEVRLLVSPETINGLAELMQSIGRRYVPYFNQKYGCSGTPWEGRYRSAVIEVKSYFLACMKYIETSEVQSIHDADSGPVLMLPSSAGQHLGLQTDSVVTDHPAFWALGNTPFERQAVYKRALDQSISPPEKTNIAIATLNGWALGCDKFLAFVEAQSGRRAHRSEPGRPPKKQGSAPC